MSSAELIPEIVQEQSDFYANELQGGASIEQALARFDAKERWGGFEVLERQTNQNGLSLRDMLTDVAHDEDMRLYLLGGRFEGMLNALEPMGTPEELREYCVWAARGTIPDEKVERELSRVLLLRKMPKTEERYKELTNIATHLDKLETAVKRRASRVVRLGIEAVDALINGGKGIYPGELLSIVGNEGSGKTALLLGILENYVAQNGRALFISLDMSVSKVEARILRRIMNCSHESLMKHIQVDSPMYHGARREREERLQGLDVLGGPIDLAGMTAAVLASRADVVAMDFVTSLALRGFRNPMEQAQAVVDWAQTIIRDWGLTVILLSQVGRNASQDMAKGGRGGHGMGSAALEQVADYELELFNDAPLQGNGSRTILTVRKNRSGPAGRSFELFQMVPSVEFSNKAEPVVTTRQRKPLFTADLKEILGR